MKIGDLVKLKSVDNVYGFVVSIEKSNWIGCRCAVVWLQNGFPTKWYALVELEALSEDR